MSLLKETAKVEGASAARGATAYAYAESLRKETAKVVAAKFQDLRTQVLSQNGDNTCCRIQLLGVSSGDESVSGTSVLSGFP